jgi:hypothetical protein
MGLWATTHEDLLQSFGFIKIQPIFLLGDLPPVVGKVQLQSQVINGQCQVPHIYLARNEPPVFYSL